LIQKIDFLIVFGKYIIAVLQGMFEEDQLLRSDLF